MGILSASFFYNIVCQFDSMLLCKLELHSFRVVLARRSQKNIALNANVDMKPYKGRDVRKEALHSRRFPVDWF